MGFGVWGLGFGVWGLGFGVWGLGFGVWGLGNFRYITSRGKHGHRNAQRDSKEKHARLWCIDRALADRLLSATLKPRQGLVLALTDSCGRELPQARAISVITQDLLSRAAAKGHGTTAMNEAINAEVHAARAQALIEASVLKEDPVTWLEVAEAIKHMPSNKASVRLPRAVARVQAYPVTLLTWALCCLIAVTSKLPSIWMREVSPVDKTGSGVIRLTRQIRPITCVDDIETILDTIWLGQVRPQLEQFMGFEQSGGRFDHIVVVIGVVLLLQARKAQQLPSLLQVADLQQGYESVWRQALRCLTRRARLKGWHWLLLDAWLGNETLRVRVGGAVGMAVSILHHSIGQGKVSGTHLFGTFATALTRTWQQHCCGLGITVDPAANLARHLCRHGAPGLQPAVHDHNAPWLDKWVKHLMPMSDVARLEEVESTAPCRFPYQQYVDDAIIPALHAPALAKANKAISDACVSWRHKFAGGKKGPRVLPVCSQPPDAAECGTLCGEPVQICGQTKLLGVFLESALDMSLQLQHADAVLRSEGCKLASGMSNAGFGMPATAAQFTLRVASKALAGCEVLASYGEGFSKAAERVNAAQYVVAKALLGIPAAASVGSRAAVLAETRLLIRAGTMVAQRIAMTRARFPSSLGITPPHSLCSGLWREMSKTPGGRTLLRWFVQFSKCRRSGTRLKSRMKSVTRSCTGNVHWQPTKGAISCQGLGKWKLSGSKASSRMLSPRPFCRTGVSAPRCSSGDHRSAGHTGPHPDGACTGSGVQPESQAPCLCSHPIPASCELSPSARSATRRWPESCTLQWIAQPCRI